MVFHLFSQQPWHWPGIFLWEPKGVFQELIESNSWSMSSFLQLFHSQLLHLPSAAVQSCPLCGLSWPIGLQFKSEPTTVKVFDGAQSIMTFFSLLKITPLCTPTVWKMIEMSVKLLFTVRWTFFAIGFWVLSYSCCHHCLYNNIWENHPPNI